MQAEEIKQIIENQRTYFENGSTQDVEIRIQTLKKLKEVILLKEDEICAALKVDLGKSKSESYMSEIGMVLDEIGHMIKRTRKYAKKQKVHTPLAQFAASSFRLPCPYGVVLVMSPWNYPFLLSMDPLIDAIAAGNTVVLKPSAYSPATSKVLESIILDVFPKSHVAVVQGGRKENQALLDQKFNYIFFTGSSFVGHEVMRKASEYLTPVTLELGGKSPCIVDETADLKVAARRIVFGKYLNCGQTCVAPDYIYVSRKVKDSFVRLVVEEIKRQFGSLDNYGKIINQKHFERLIGLMNPKKLVYGGKYDQSTLQIEPTVFDQITWDDAIMQEEIFGPLMPILTFDSIDSLISLIQSKPTPLALYYFSKDQANIEKVMKTVGFGGGCINDTIIHLATSAMPFGGLQESGMGGYHGYEGFKTFSHYKSIVNKKTWLDLPMRYQPYTKKHDKIIRMFLK